ncbi:hypothetical protein Pelo_17908 [Pelomyxa schiedti]|nr:hypothetical protein Pelo_17908 [Pelomyxa schiedti]
MDDALELCRRLDEVRPKPATAPPQTRHPPKRSSRPDRERACFGCGQTGHVVRDCPKYRQQANTTPISSAAVITCALKGCTNTVPQPPGKHYRFCCPLHKYQADQQAQIPSLNTTPVTAPQGSTATGC